MLLNAFDCVGHWREMRRRTGHMLIALDFDGTIAPIVPQPQEAWMTDAARAAIERLLKRNDTDVAIISGRSIDDLRARCDIEGLYFAGNHGLQLHGPDVHETRAEARELLPHVRAFRSRLDDVLDGFDDIFLEDKELTLSIHYRAVENEAEGERVREAVERAFAQTPEGMRLTYGKKVVEVRPDTDWNKGDATIALIESVERARNSPVFTLFLGDDRTDEDAFRAVRHVGAGVIVAESPPADTHARARVSNVDQAVALLNALAE